MSNYKPWTSTRNQNWPIRCLVCHRIIGIGSGNYNHITKDYGAMVHAFWNFDFHAKQHNTSTEREVMPPNYQGIQYRRHTFD